jgi:hypothetical protein
MLNSEQIEIAVSLVRKHARIMRGEPITILGLMNSLVWAQEAQLPDQFLLPLSSSLHKTLAQGDFVTSALPLAVGLLFKKNQLCAARNLESLKCLESRIVEESGIESGNAILAGDGAVLSGLYGDPGALPSAQWAALLQDGTLADCSKSRWFGAPEEDWSEKIDFGNRCWRRPKPAFLMALLAAHVGDPSAPLASFQWQHLGLAVLAWKGSIQASEVCDIGNALGKLEQVTRGLAIATEIFSEAAEWLKTETLKIPAWERRFALAIAAHRLIVGERN